jgi:hypothetical protein
MKRVSVIAILLCVLVPALALGVDQGKRDIFKLGEAQFKSEAEFTVPVSILHDENIVAMDIPLGWTEGVTLKEVLFAERVDYFDVKIANIDEEKNQVLIGLISMVHERKDPLRAGDGLVAELNFIIDDFTVEEIEITPFETKNPGHKLSLVYNEWNDGKPTVAHANPEVQGNPVSLAERGIPPTPGPIIPDEYALGQNYPNPFNPTTTLAYSLKQAGHVTLSIFNVLGQNVRTLVNEHQDAGKYTIIWDGCNDTGDQTTSGVYFYRIKSGDFSDIKKMILMK